MPTGYFVLMAYQSPRRHQTRQCETKVEMQMATTTTFGIQKRVWSLLLPLVIISVAAVEAKFYSTPVARQALITDLFVNYDAGAKPSPKGERIFLHVNMVMQHFTFRETDGAFHFVGLLNVAWQDPKLGWNPFDYNNLTRIPIRQKLIWVPDLEVYNNAPDKFLRMHHHGAVSLEHTGIVLWTDNIEVTTFCTMHMQNWPNDQHECKLSLGSWTYDGYELDFKNFTNPNETLSFEAVDMSTMGYQMINFTAERVATVYNCCAEPYLTINFNIVFARHSSFVIIFRVLALSVTILSLLALCVEAGCSSKIYLNSISLVITVITLIYFTHHVGSFARTTPYIVIFFSCGFVMVTLTQLLSVFSLFATHSSCRGKLHHLVLRFLRSSFVSYIGPKQNVDTEQRDNVTELNTQFEDVTLQEFSNLLSANSTPFEWVQFANVLQRIAFIVFGCIYLILYFICFV